MRIKSSRADKQPKGFVMSILSNPWIVLAVVFAALVVLLSRILVPLTRQIFGGGGGRSSGESDTIPPHLRMRRPTGGDEAPSHSRPTPHFGRGAGAGPGMAAATGATGSSKSLFTYILPVYAVGIGIYMIYTLYKVMNKKATDGSGVGGDGDTVESDYEDYRKTGKKSRRVKFQERANGLIRPLGKRAATRTRRVRPDDDYEHDVGEDFEEEEEDEDEADEEEVEKSKSKSKLQRKKTTTTRRRDRDYDEDEAAEEEEEELNDDDGECEGERVIPLSNNTGLTSITNTNVLMNETLDRMKYQLNKINSKLTTMEQKSNPLDDPELECLRLQLTQTELQMAKILNIVNSVSSTIQTEKKKLSYLSDGRADLVPLHDKHKDTKHPRDETTGTDDEDDDDENENGEEDDYEKCDYVEGGEEDDDNVDEDDDEADEQRNVLEVRAADCRRGKKNCILRHRTHASQPMADRVMSSIRDDDDDSNTSASLSPVSTHSTLAENSSNHESTPPVSSSLLRRNVVASEDGGGRGETGPKSAEKKTTTFRDPIKTVMPLIEKTSNGQQQTHSANTKKAKLKNSKKLKKK